MGYSQAVRHRTLTPTSLVQVQLPQPGRKPNIFNLIRRSDVLDNKERFLALCETVDRGFGFHDLLDWLEETDFYIAPASSKYHGAHPGGLLEHSLNVYDELKRLLNAYPEIKVSEESVVIAALFHDLCKVNFYATEKRNRKNESGQWESYDSAIFSFASIF